MAKAKATIPTVATDETYNFETEVARLLQMMVHSVYTERAIFLRELISNAADACDRRRYEALTDAALLGDDPLEIVITADPQARTLTISDSGVGMSRQELIDNLGTIARSGTQRFLETTAEGGRPELIGQFGVGFYAAFMVADTVSVISRRAGSQEAWRWQSDGLGSFAVAAAQRESTGTSIVLHLKEDASEFAEKPRLSHIIRTYSDHIAVPIKLGVAAEVPEAVNRASALWTRPKSEISDQDYAEFYRHSAGAWDEPLTTLHFRAEGRLEYTGLLFIPSQPPFDLFDPERKSRIKLYIKRVFITEACGELLPAWLRFLRGIVDAQDLSLNISREMLQSNPVLAQMKKAITSRVLSELAKLAKDKPDDYLKFWEQFGRVLKEGLYEDFERREELLALARFKSTAVEGWTSLADAVARMKEGQEALYYLSAEESAGLASPQLEGYRSRGLEVLLMSDPVDDFWLQMIDALDGKPLHSITRSSEDLSKFEPAQTPAQPAADATLLIAAMKTALGEAVKDVRVSNRLTDSAVCLVADAGDMDLRLQRMLKAGDRLQSLTPRVLEINPHHALITALSERASNEPGAAVIADAAHLLLDQARIIEGEPIADPAGFARRMASAIGALVG
jgi:molecular chaperone HtpG